MGRGLQDDEIADLIHTDPSEIQGRVDGILERLAGDLSLESREERAELRATLPDLPRDVWQEAPRP